MHPVGNPIPRQPVRVVRHQPSSLGRPSSPCPFVGGQVHHVAVEPTVQAVRCNVHQAGERTGALERMRRAVEVAQRARERAEALARGG